MKIPLVLVASMLLGAAITPAIAADAWPFATMMAMTGSYASYSTELKLGFQTAVDDINRNGGIRGRPVNLEMMDTQSNPAQVATLIRQACNQALIVVGPAQSNEARVAFPVANSMHCPAIAAAAAAVGLTQSNRPWTFSYLTPSNVATDIVVDRLVKKSRPKKAVVIIEKDDLSASDFGSMVSKALSRNRVATESIVVSSSDIDFSPVVTRAVATGPDLIVISALDRATIGLLKELRKSQQHASILLTQPAFNGVVGTAVPPDALEGVLRYAQSDLGGSTDPRAQAFVKAYLSRSGGHAPTLVASLAYDTMMLVKDVVDTAGLKGDDASRAADRQKFIERLATVRDWPGIGGRVSMSPQGYMIQAPLLLQYHAGKWQQVDTQ
jgi:branched-chain amino acid transport system substrate-binding protein